MAKQPYSYAARTASGVPTSQVQSWPAKMISANLIARPATSSTPWPTRLCVKVWLERRKLSAALGRRHLLLNQ